ncbi:MAG: hypothetical protein M9907_04460 [Burkholderiaceae bacterium]|nr:hypothetical protein [Burkholderiaceae bacterium]
MTPDESSGSASIPPGRGPDGIALARVRRLVEGGASALVAALDHVLQQNDWARARLAGFAGRLVLIGVDLPGPPGLPPPQLLARIVEGGLLEPLPWPDGAEPEAAVRMLLRPSVDAAFAWLREGARGLTPHLRLDGDAALAEALGEIARQLRWDPEEDLSRVAGDALARRVGAGVDAGRATMRDLRARVETSAVGHLAGDGGQLVAQGELDAMRAALDALEARVARLDARTRGATASRPAAR